MKKRRWICALVCALCVACLSVSAQAGSHHDGKHSARHENARYSATQPSSNGGAQADETQGNGRISQILEDLLAADAAWDEDEYAYDWRSFAGAHYTPQEITGQFGEPDEIEGLLYDPGEDGEGEPVYDTAEGVQYAVYHYLDFSFHLFVNPQDGQWTIEALEIRRPLSPVTIEGVSVGMEWGEAVSSLQAGGYAQNMDIWNGSANLYFEKYDEQGNLCMVEICLGEDGAVASARGLWGAVAEMEKADYMS